MGRSGQDNYRNRPSLVVMIQSTVGHSIRVSSCRNSIRSFSFFLCLMLVACSTATANSARPPEVSTAPVIVIGFVGGFVRHDNGIHTTVQVAEHLRRDYPSGVHVEVYENHHSDKAYAAVVQFLDVNHDGVLSAEEKKNARIILYGHSWGASETVALARQLEKEGIPVLLTIQVDSVVKPGEDDRLIPANVAEAANFYQLDGFLH